MRTMRRERIQNRKEAARIRSLFLEADATPERASAWIDGVDEGSDDQIIPRSGPANVTTVVENGVRGILAP